MRKEEEKNGYKRLKQIGRGSRIAVLRGSHWRGESSLPLLACVSIFFLWDPLSVFSPSQKGYSVKLSNAPQFYPSVCVGGGRHEMLSGPELSRARKASAAGVPPTRGAPSILQASQWPRLAHAL